MLMLQPNQLIFIEADNVPEPWFLPLINHGSQENLLHFRSACPSGWGHSCSLPREGGETGSQSNSANYTGELWKDKRKTSVS